MTHARARLRADVTMGRRDLAKPVPQLPPTGGRGVEIFLGPTRPAKLMRLLGVLRRPPGEVRRPEAPGASAYPAFALNPPRRRRA